MEGTPHLLTDVKFDERRRGYDPDQVDNFLERVAEAVSQLQDKLREATARAEDADSKISEAKRAQSVAEARADKLKADLDAAGSAPSPADASDPGPDPASTADAAANVLVMAQKAADATLDEAKRNATTTVNDARAKAASLVAEAEREVERMLSEARRRSKEMLDEHSTAVLEQARTLEQTRDQLSGDVDALRGHLDAHREALRAQLGEILAVLDDEKALRVAPAPTPSTASVVGLVGDETGADEPVSTDAPPADTAETDAPAAGTTTPEEAGEPVSSAAEEPSGTDAAPVSDSTDDERDTAPEEPGPTESNEDATTPVGSSIAEEPDEGSLAEPERGPEDTPTAAVDVAELLEPVAPKRDLDLTTERLFGNDEDASSTSAELRDLTGSTTELFSTTATDVVPRESVSRSVDSALGRTDARADEAMKAFFEADFDRTDRPEPRARFGRRR